MISQRCVVIGVLCVHLFISNLTGTVSNSFPNVTELEKNSLGINRCMKQQFQCKSGQCIPEFLVCDGFGDCNDDSDEFRNACQEKIRKKNSCAAPLPSPDKIMCLKTIQSQNCTQIDGDYGDVPEWTEIIVTCAPGYFRSDSETNPVHTCYKSQWSPKIDKCLRSCDQLNPVNVVLECSRNGLPIDKCDNNSILLAGTKVIPTCIWAYKYEFPPNYNEITCKEDGKWDKDLLSCVPVCGKPCTKSLYRIKRGTPECNDASPWHVAIFYKKKTLICGGTIISELLVLSAAHCFKNRKNVNNWVDEYEVIVGKYTNNYNKQDNDYQTIMKIKEIRFPDKYLNSTEDPSQAADLAIIIFEEKIPFGAAIKPACLNWTDLNGKYPSDGELGKVAGWGATENGSLSTILRSAYLPFISYQTCMNTALPDFKPYVTLDKFCAGTRNLTGAAVMNGDSGGGILFKEESLFYLQGVVSLKAYTTDSIAVYTDLNFYIRWIALVRDQIEKKIETPEIQPPGKNTTIVPQTPNVDDNKKRLPDEIVFDIQSDDFSSAEKKLQQSPPLTYIYVTRKVYDHHPGNFDLLLRFASSVQDIDQKLKLYDALLNEMRASGHNDRQKLAQLSRNIQREILSKNVDSQQRTMAQSILDRIAYNEIVDLIRSHEFVIAEQKLTKYGANFPYSRLANEISFDLLSSFAQSAQSVATKFKLYDVLFNETKNNDYTDNGDKLLQLYSLVKKEVNESLKNYEPAKLLFDEIRTATVEQTAVVISSGFENEGIWSNVQLLAKDAFKQDFQILYDVYNMVIEMIWDKLSVPEMLRWTNQAHDQLIERMAVHEAIANQLQRIGQLATTNAIPLARHMKQVQDDSAFKADIPKNWQSRYEELKNKLPSSVKNVVFSSRVCLKNNAYNEYFFVSGESTEDGNKHYIYTIPLKNQRRLLDFKWKVNFTIDNQVYFRNIWNDEYLHANINQPVNNNKRNALTQKTREFLLNNKWNLEIDGDAVYIKSFFQGYLFADDESKSGKRQVFIFASEDIKPSGGYKWEIVDCV